MNIMIMDLLLTHWADMTRAERESFSLDDAKAWCDDELMIDDMSVDPEDVLKIVQDFNAAFGTSDDINEEEW